MENYLPSIVLAITTFALTNIDDLMILSMYFSNHEYKKSNVVAGQYLGVITLVIVSLSGFILGKVLEPIWVGLLGLIPILLGLKGIIALFSSENEETQNAEGASKSKTQFINVALVTIANGGDNLGVYTPLFANNSLHTVILFVIVFLVMIAVWCVLAFYFVKHPFIEKILGRYGHIILPIFLIVLGIWILRESGSFNLLF
ncbi:MAG: cadmium resistance transporter [Sporocytophaga sp.]|uniref:cadmium resistance transporter n=1 Tax=Sporocytophaga sp. TaxID=2231183 RepID=UPI001B026D04|nr:cadmium resistance transporter [Sporocytophaga sp.]MBO9700103.1 cadmium resistance transporter [Sporocytophaga sp.]